MVILVFILATMIAVAYVRERVKADTVVCHVVICFYVTLSLCCILMMLAFLIK
jgi:hypothetical protein